MINIGTVWDRTMSVIAGRFGILLSLALLLLIAPPLVQAAIDTLSGPSFAIRAMQMAMALVVFVAAAIGAIAITAVASSPDVDRASALAIGRARLGPFIGVSLIIGLTFGLISLPGLILVGVSGFSVEQARAGGAQDAVNLTLLGIGILYLFLLAPLMLWAAARLVPLGAVIVNERRGIGAIARSFALTRGATLKLIGVLILYGVVFLVVLTAATSVIGLVARLLAGANGTVAVSLAVAAATAFVTALFSILQAVFGASLYAAAQEAHEAA